MTAVEIFNEVLNSSELTDIFKIPQEELKNQSYNITSDYQVVEVIKAIIRGEDSGSDNSAIFRSIQNLIMQIV